MVLTYNIQPIEPFVINMEFQQLSKLPKRKENPFIEDVFFEIFSFIPPNVKFIKNCRPVCKQWNTMIMNPKLWNNVEVYVPNLQKLPSQFKLILTRIKCNPKIHVFDLEHISGLINLQQY